ncbi:MAG: Hsp70 family protein, partial [Patescibacteria group bacterium]
QIEVTFDIDANGILNVKAKDKATNKEQSIKIEGSSGLTDEEKKRMSADAEKFAAEDAKKKELVDARNMAETLTYSTEKALKEAGDKISAEERKNIEDKIAALNDTKKSEDVGVIKKATEELSAAAQKIGEILYKQQSASAEATADKQGQKPAEEAKTEDEKKEEGKPEEK